MPKDFKDLTMKGQMEKIQNWKNPVVFACGGVVVFRNPNGLKTEVEVMLNTTKNKPHGKTQPYYGGYAEVGDTSPLQAAFRELQEESGYQKNGPATFLGVFGPQIKNGRVTFDVDEEVEYVKYVEGEELASAHPIMLSMFAIDKRNVAMVSEPDKEVTNRRWMSVEDVIREYGTSNEFDFQVVLAAFVDYLLRGDAFEPWLDMPSQESL